VNRDWFWERLRRWGDREAIVGDDLSANYSDLMSLKDRWMGELAAAGVEPGRVVAFEGDCRDGTVALLLALLENGCVAVPLASAAKGQRLEFLEIAQAEFLVGEPGAGTTGQASGPIVHRGNRHGHPLIEKLAESGRPGLVLFSSGSTGKPNAMIDHIDEFLVR
jgi:non-ribosomal peptide synthetase component F